MNIDKLCPYFSMMHKSLLSLMLFLATAASAQTYSFIELGTIAGGDWRSSGGPYSYTFGINNNGEIVGRSTKSFLTVLQSGTSHAAKWTATTVADLGTLGGSNSGATAINTDGKIVGYSTTATGREHATLFAGGSNIDLGTLGAGYIKSRATGINSSGVIVGYSSASDNVLSERATLWNGSSTTDLETIGGTYGRATGINDSSQAVGYSATIGNQRSHATSWSHTIPVDLGTLGGNYSSASAINNIGRIVGRSQTTGDTSSHATLWSGGNALDLGTLGGTWSEALSINNFSQIVGWSYTTANAEQHATLWTENGSLDLNLAVANLEDGWILQDASAINDHGWITGQAINSFTGANVAYLLIPTLIPEPASLLLLLFGLGGIKIVIRSRTLGDEIPNLANNFRPLKAG